MRKLKLFIIALCAFAGNWQKAAADSNSTIGHGGQTYTLFDSEDYYTATDGSNTSWTYTYEYLVDNVIVPDLYKLPYKYTYWMTEDDNLVFIPKFIEFYSAEPIVAKGYRLRTGVNTKNHPNRRPKSWTLKGKKHADDAQWTVLASVTNDNNSLPAEAEATSDHWLTSNTNPYQYFRFEVNTIQGPEVIQVTSNISYTRYRMELSELQIIGNKYNANYDLDYATIEGLQHYYVHTGNNITPEFTVKDMSGNTLTEGTHYTVSYSPSVPNDVGTYTLTVTGKSPYTGKQNASFKVVNTLSGDGTSGNPYVIADAKDWYVFGKYIKEVVGQEHMNTKYYKLADNFDNSNEPITEMIATDANYPFCGTLDGNNKTIHIAIKANSEAGCAPFRYLKGATIQNLTVAGYAATSSKFGASIAVDNLNDGANTTYITDCYSRVNIASSVNGDGNNGGFLGENHGSILFTRCAFLGRMLGTKATSNGGFLGWNNDAAKSLTFSQCVFDPVRVSMYDANSKTFSRNDAKKPSIDQNTYFTYAGWGTDQGTQAVALTTAPANLGNVVSAEGTMTLYENALLCGGKYYVTNLSLYDNASNATLLRDADGKQLNVTLSGRTLFKDGAWNTLCLPFDLSSAEVSQLLDNVGTLMELDTEGTYDTDKQTGFDTATGTLRLYFKDASEIKAGRPYIIKWTSGENLANKVFENVKIDNSDDALTRQAVESEDKHVQFIGTYSPVELTIGDKSNLLLGNKNTLFYPTGGNNGDNENPRYFVNAFRAYFHIDPGTAVKEFILGFGDSDSEDGINGLTPDLPPSRMGNSLPFMGPEPHSVAPLKTPVALLRRGEIYNLSGQRLSKPQKGIYIINGKKVLY